MADFNPYVDQLDMDLWRRLCAREGTLRRYKKGECFLRSGAVARRMGLVERGYFKYTVTDAAGGEHISGFAFPRTLVGDYLSTTRQTPALARVVAVADSEVLECSGSAFCRILREDPELHLRVADALFRQAYGLYLDTHRLSPKERYVRLLRQCPGILQSITLRELASYLQITPTHLSRLRREITFAPAPTAKGGRQGGRS